MCVYINVRVCVLTCMSVFDIDTVMPEPLLGVASIRPITRSFVSSSLMYTDFGS